LLCLLRPLRHHAALESLRKCNDPLHDGARAPVVQHAAHKGLVDLETVDGEIAQTGERRIAGTEIVEHEAHAKFAAGVDDRAHMGDVLQGD